VLSYLHLVPPATVFLHPSGMRSSTLPTHDSPPGFRLILRLYRVPTTSHEASPRYRFSLPRSLHTATCRVISSEKRGKNLGLDALITDQTNLLRVPRLSWNWRS